MKNAHVHEAPNKIKKRRDSSLSRPIDFLISGLRLPQGATSLLPKAKVLQIQWLYLHDRLWLLVSMKRLLLVNLTS